METYEFMKNGSELFNKIYNNYSLWAKRHGISYNELSVLYTVFNNGKCTQKCICDEWFLPKQTVNSVCKNMIKTVIIIMEQNPMDKRETLISLTPKGRSIAEPITNELLTVEENVMQSMGKEKLIQFMSLYREYALIVEQKFGGKA